MEAATPLRKPSVRTIGDRLAIDGLVVEDACIVDLVREREHAGEDPAALVTDAIEIGARVLDREQTAANADFVRTEFEKAAAQVEAAFAERAGGVVDEIATAFERHFSDDSSGAIQHRVKAQLADVLVKAREDIRRQFSATDGDNPLADFKNEQRTHLQNLLAKLSALELEVQRLHAEREKEAELEIERDRGTAKGRTYEEEVFEAVDALAAAQGDDCEAVGDTKGATRKTGDVTVAIEAARGPAKGRIVFEAKNSKLSKPEALRELDRARAERDADYAVLVVSGEDKLPARSEQLREFNGDKLFVVYDAEDGPLALALAYRLARARVLMARGAGDEGIDAAAIADTVQRAVQSLDDERAVKQQLTGATTSIQKARDVLEAMAARVREQLAEIDRLLSAGE